MANALDVGARFRKAKGPITFFFLAIICVILVCIATFKPVGLDRDSINYVAFLDAAVIHTSLLSKEPFFWLARRLDISLFGGSTPAFFFLFALPSIVYKFGIISQVSRHPWLSLWIYFSLFYVLQDLTQIRAGLAIAFFLGSLTDLSDGRFGRYMAKAAAATACHYSAAVMFPLYLARRLPRLFPALLILPILGVVLPFVLPLQSVLHWVGFALPGFVEKRVFAYFSLTSNGKQDHINLFNTLYMLLLFQYYLVLFGQPVRQLSNFDSLLLVIFGLGLFSFFFFREVPVFSFRISEFLCSSVIILFGNAADRFRPSSLYALLTIAWTLGYFVQIELLRSLNWGVLGL